MFAILLQYRDGKRIQSSPKMDVVVDSCRACDTLRPLRCGKPVREKNSDGSVDGGRTAEDRALAIPACCQEEHLHHKCSTGESRLVDTHCFADIRLERLQSPERKLRTAIRYKNQVQIHVGFIDIPLATDQNNMALYQQSAILCYVDLNV